MKKLLPISLVLALVAGCVPASRITYGNARAYLPKNFIAKDFEVRIDTNGMLIHASLLIATNSAQVIDASTAQAVAVIQATGDAFSKVAAKAP